MNKVDINLAKPHGGQRTVLLDNSRFKVLMCGRRWGKSLLAQVISILEMLNKHQVCYITPTYRLANHFFVELLKVIPSSIIKTANKSDLYIELVTGGSILFFSGEGLERMRGYKFHYCIIDEAAYIDNLEYYFTNVIRAVLSDYSGKCLFISTPRGTNYFYSLFLKGLELNNEGFRSFKFPSSSNPYFNKTELEVIKNSIPSIAYLQEYECVPSANQNNPFTNIQNNVSELSGKPTIIFGVDVAKTQDYTVIVGLDNDGNMSYYDSFQLPWELTQQRILNLPINVPIWIDSTGVGSVLLEQLQRMRKKVNGYVFTNETKNNLIYQLIKKVETGSIKYNSEAAKEMEVYEYKYTKHGNIVFGHQAGYHDDIITALALASFHHQQSKTANWKLLIPN